MLKFAIVDFNWILYSIGYVMLFVRIFSLYCFSWVTIWSVIFLGSGVYSKYYIAETLDQNQ